MTGLLSCCLRIAVVAACLKGMTPQTVLAQPVARTPTPKVADAGRTVRACKVIAAVADRDAGMLKAADLSRRGTDNCWT